MGRIPPHIPRLLNIVFFFVFVFQMFEPALGSDRSVPFCQKTDTPLNIDGKLDEPAWIRADTLTPFVKMNGKTLNKQISADFKTSVKLLWDEKYLYVGAVLQDPDIWGTFKKHDDPLYTQDVFEIFIDPDGSGSFFYEFQFNVREAMLDSLMLRKGNRSKEFNIWHAEGVKQAVKIKGTLENREDRDEHWGLEIRIPWQNFFQARPIPPRAGDVWRLNFYRIEYPKNGETEYSAWSPTDQFQKTQHFGRIMFVDPKREKKVRDSIALAKKWWSRRDQLMSWRLDRELKKAKIYSPGTGVYQVKGQGFTAQEEWGSVSVKLDDDPKRLKLPAGTIFVHPREVGDPTILEFDPGKNRILYFWFRMPDSAKKRIDTGISDGVGLSVEVLNNGKVRYAFKAHCDDTVWRLSIIDLEDHENIKVRLTVDEGPATLTSDRVCIIIGSGSEARQSEVSRTGRSKGR